ncbi:uncharacterized protein LOC106135845 [Amyelois transitella]|uniref:uncharacterized protein LOC106135845 n=1 Tax=Amyelois transitella TaxID=680683 RepID=UPI0029900EA3|nr:uncharacterized protein LOC106135845 [Amyelois transitella]
MLKITIFFSTLLFASGAVFYLPDLSHLDDNDVTKEAKFNSRKVEQRRFEDVFVLEMNEEGLDLRTLRVADEKETVIFERVVGPMIEAFKCRPAKNLTRNPAAQTTSKSERKGNANEMRNKKIKQAMLRLINKFTMSIKSDPDAFITDSASSEANGPSLALYIQGVFTSLMVSSDRKEWHFFIPPPSPLPAWLYRNHDAPSVDIPDDVRDQLFEKLLHLLHMFLSFPL